MTPPPRKRMSTARVFALVLLAMGAVASAEFYALWRAHDQARADRAPVTAAAPA
jgi:cytochrome c-type biogenesis protein CcmH/NrfG